MLLFAVAALALMALPLVAQQFGQGWVRIMALALLYVLLTQGQSDLNDSRAKNF